MAKHTTFIAAIAASLVTAGVAQADSTYAGFAQVASVETSPGTYNTEYVNLQEAGGLRKVHVGRDLAQDNLFAKYVVVEGKTYSWMNRFSAKDF